MMNFRAFEASKSHAPAALRVPADLSRARARARARRFAFRPSALEMLEARIQMDASVLLGHAPNQIEFDGPLSVSYDSDQHSNTYTTTAGQAVNIKIAATDLSLIRLQGSSSFVVYDPGYEPSGYLPSFTIGSDAVLSVYDDPTVQQTETIWSGGAVTFGVDQLFATGGVPLPSQNPNHLEVDGSLFTPTSVQLYFGAGSNPGPQVHLQGIAGFNGTNLNPTITTPSYVQIGPNVTESIQGTPTVLSNTGTFTLKGMAFNPINFSMVHQPGTDLWSFWGGIAIRTTGTDNQTPDDKFQFVGLLGADQNHPGLQFQGKELVALNLDLSASLPNSPDASGVQLMASSGGKPTNVTGKEGFAFDFTWIKATDTFAVSGTAGYQSVRDGDSGAFPAPGFVIEFGDINSPGFTLQNGKLIELAVSASTNFALGPVQVSAKNIGLKYMDGNDTTDATLAFFGEVTVQLTDSWKGATVDLGTGFTDPGFVVDLNTGKVKLDDIGFQVHYIPLGGFIIQDLSFNYRKTSDTDFEITAGGDLILPAGWAIGVGLTFDDKGLESITGLFQAVGNPGIEIGDTGLALNTAEVTVTNIETPEEIGVSGTATFVFGDALKIGGTEVAPFVAVGSFYVDRHKLDLDGTLYFMAYATPGTTGSNGLTQQVWHSVIADPAEASLKLDWSAGIYSVSVTDLTFESVFELSGSITFDKHGDIVISAEADVVVPKFVPLIGGTHLAAMDFLFAYDHETKSGFAAAWVEVNLLVKKVEAGFEYAFDEGQHGKFSLIGAKTIGKLQDEASGFIQGSNNGTSTFTYSYTVSVDTNQGTDGLTVQVDYPNLGGTQTVQVNLPGQSTPISLTPNAQPTIGPGGVQLQVLTGAAGALILQVNGSPTDPSVVIPAGDYSIALVSSQQFDQSSVTFSSLLHFVPPTVILAMPEGAGATANAPYFASTLNVMLTGTVAPGLVESLNGQAPIKVFIDADNDGIDFDGVQVGKLTVDLADDGTWSAPFLLDFNGYLSETDIRIYATIDDSVSPVVFSQTLANIKADPLISGRVSNVTSGGVNLGNVPGIVVFIDLNQNGIYDAASGSTDTDDLVMEPAFVTDAIGGYTIDLSTYPDLYLFVDGQDYDVVLLLPSDRYVAYSPSGTPPTQSFRYDGSSHELDFSIVAPTVISGTVYDDPSGTAWQTDSDTLELTGTGLGGQVVYLDTNNNGQLDDGELSTTTGASGRYAFYNFAGVDFPANFNVRVIVPAHVLQTGPNASYTVTVQADQDQEVQRDFYFRRLASVSGQVVGYGLYPSNGQYVLPTQPAPLPGRQVYATVEVANFPDFPEDGPNASQFSFAGHAFFGDDASNAPVLVPAFVNPDGSDAAGAAWLASPIAIDGGFEATFQWLSNSEGFAFVIQPGSNTALGGNLGNLGYGDLANSLAVEFDMFQNGTGFNDPDGNHISVHLNGSADENDTANLLGRIDSGPLDFHMNDSAVHTARIVYLPGVLQIFLNGSQTPSLTVNVNLPDILGGANTPAYLGFTASAISADAFTSILNFELRQVAGSATTAADGSYTIYDLLPQQAYEIIQKVPQGWRQLAPESSEASYQPNVFDLSPYAGNPLFVAAPVSVDVNRDGHDDLVFATIAGDSHTLGYTIVFGDGRGGVLATGSWTIGSLRVDASVLFFASRARLVSGYFDATDHESFALMLEGRTASSTPSSLGLYFQIDPGTFNAGSVRWWSPNRAGSIDDVAVGDFDGDRYDELILSATQVGTNAGDVYLIPHLTFSTLHSPVGVYQPMISAPINAPISLAAGDINGDSVDDFVLFVPTYDGTGSFYPDIFYSQGQDPNVDRIDFAQSIQYGLVIPGETAVVTLGDLDGDGRLDLIFMSVDDQGVGTLRYALQTSLYSFALGMVTLDDGTRAVDQLPLPGVANDDGSLPRPLAEDFNGDGLIDLAVVTSQGETVTLLINQGLSFLDKARRSDFDTIVALQSHNLGIGDFNGDGLPDLFGNNMENPADTGANDVAYLLQSTGAGSGAIPVQLVSGQQSTVASFTSVQYDPDLGLGQGSGAPGRGSISGVVYRDDDRDGVRRGDEPGLSGVRVFIDLDRDGKQGPSERSTVTNAEGAYHFDDLPAGLSYQVRLILQASLSSTSLLGAVAEALPRTVLSPRFQDFGVTPNWIKAIPDLNPGDRSPIVINPERTAAAPAGRLTYHLAPGAPAGATIDPVTGRFTWAPSADLAPGAYPITIRITQRGTIDVTESRSFVITLPAVNHAPTLSPIADRAIAEGQTLVIKVTGRDADAGQVLTYSLDRGAPAGMVIDPKTGVITWTPVDRLASGLVIVRVTDDATPAQSTTASFRVSVIAVAPTVTLPGTASVALGSSLALTGSFAAPGRSSWTATADYGDGSGPRPLALFPDRSFQLELEYAAAGTYTITVAVRDADGLVGIARTLATVVGTSDDAPAVRAIVIGDGSAQRSIIRSLTVAFDRLVSVDAGTFELRDRAGRLVPMNLSFTVIGGGTVVTLTFRPRARDGVSLANGDYRLTMKPERVHDTLGQAPSAIAPVVFRRRFGDLNGDGRVDRFEVRAARKAIGTRPGNPAYQSGLDLQGSGLIHRRVLRRVVREWLRRS